MIFFKLFSLFPIHYRSSLLPGLFYNTYLRKHIEGFPGQNLIDAGFFSELPHCEFFVFFEGDKLPVIF